MKQIGNLPVANDEQWRPGRGTGGGGPGPPADFFYKGAKACLWRRKLEKSLIKTDLLGLLEGSRDKEDTIKFKTL